MPPRPYNSDLRRRQQAELAARIAAVAAALHARNGVHGTSYADIAAAAGVSIPTVYAHFPSQQELLRGCTGHVAASAPPLPVDGLLAAPDLRAAIGLLVEAVDRRHRHFAPWQAWREDRTVPFLAEMAAATRKAQAALIAQLLDRHLGPGDHRETVAAWEALLSFDFWHRLVHGHGLSQSQARAVIVRCLLALVAAPPSSPTPKPRRSPR